jgi:MerR family regulatory protein
MVFFMVCCVIAVSFGQGGPVMLTIGQVAKKLGVCVKTLKRWDKDGSVKPHLRTPGGHRRYGQETSQGLTPSSGNAADTVTT